MVDFRVYRSFRAPATHLCGITWDGRHLWHSDGTTDLIYCLDATTGEVLDQLDCGQVRTELVYVDGHLWQLAGQPKRIVKIDLGTREVIGTHGLGEEAELICGLDVDERYYWLSRKDTGEIQARSRGTDEVTLTYHIGEPADGIVVVDDTVWYTSYSNAVVGAFDTTVEETVVRYQLDGKPTGVCGDGELFWYCDYERNQIIAAEVK